MDVSGASCESKMPAIHAGMTKIRIFILLGERKLMNHFVALICSRKPFMQERIVGKIQTRYVDCDPNFSCFLRGMSLAH
jgi:hypothetical protein